MTALADQPRTAPYMAYGAARAFWGSKDPECLVEGPRNTGKSRVVMEKAWGVAQKYPRARICIVRATRASMTESVIKTFEEEVLLGRPDILEPTHDRATRTHYNLPNGARIVVAGLDNPDRFLSAEYDMVCVFQAEETKLDQWEKLIGCLRNKKMPYQQAVADCNPAHPGHWLNERANAGMMRRFITRHEDNPACTPEDLDRLRRLTGVRRLRLYEGKWAGSEGIVYDRWDRAVHVKVREGPWARVIVGVDYGYTNPTAAVRVCIDGDGRAHVEAEGYGKGLNEAGQVALVRDIHSGCEAVVVDPSAAGLRAALHAADTPVVEAENDVVAGINRVQDRLVVAGDGLPRLTVDPSCTNLIREFESYEWLPDKPKDTPKKENDHCLTAGTLVTTADGPKPIEKVTHRDEVWTRAGWRAVTWAAMTSPAAQVYRVTFSDGRSLVGTASHPVWTTSDGFIPLLSLQCGTCVDALKSPTLIVKRAPSGVRLMGLSLGAGTSITGTATPSTTFSQTWNASLPKPTLHDTRATRTGRKKREQRAPNGMAAKRGERGTQSTLGVSGWVEFQPGRYAWSAEWPTRPTFQPAPSSATRTAKRRLSVVAVEKLGVEPVYNLSVRDQPEFYANGVLVHNCMDALRYAVMHVDQAGEYGGGVVLAGDDRPAYDPAKAWDARMARNAAWDRAEDLED